MTKRSFDPELIRQLNEARESGDTVEAVVSLQHTAGLAPLPSVVREQAQEAIERATSASGEAPADVHVMPNLATV